MIAQELPWGSRRFTERVHLLGASLARRAAGAGLVVTQADGTQRPIPIAALPLVVSDAEVDRRRSIADLLCSATAKTARWRMAGTDRDAVLAALGPAEWRLVEATWDRGDELAVARVDFMDGAGGLAALEVNATIPAMQAYSDIAAAAWLETFASGRVDLDELIAANGSNSDALLDSLLTSYRSVRNADPSNIGLLCRRGDAQSTELVYLRERFARAGVHARIVHPDELIAGANGFLVHQRTRLDLVYRHLFLGRLDATPSPAFEDALRAGAQTPGTLVLNRPAPHLEMKSTLAAISRATVDSALARAIGLSTTELDAVSAHVPWTRTLSDVDPQLVDEVAAQPDEFVLKRSWSYGGSEVYLGRSQQQAGFWHRVQHEFPGASRWDELVRSAARDARRGGFIVQRAIPRSEAQQFLCTPAGVDRVRVVTDYAAFASIGSSPGWGGVSRAAASDVVNIVGGGGVVPVIRSSVANRVFD